MGRAEEISSNAGLHSPELQIVGHIEAARVSIKQALDIGKVSIDSLIDIVALTPMQISNLGLISYGFSARQSAEKLEVSIHSVKSHRKSASNKLRARTSPHEVRIGFELGYLTKELESIDTIRAPLSPAEQNVLELSSLGFNKYEIAGIRGTSFNTIAKQRNGILRKLNAINMAHAVRKAFEYGIIIINLEQPKNTFEASKSQMLSADALLVSAAENYTRRFPPLFKK